MVTLYRIVFSILVLVLANPVLAAPQEVMAAKEAVAKQVVKVHRNYKPRVGQAHPDFILPTVEDGTNIQLSDYRGKKVLLLQFASW